MSAKNVTQHNEPLCIVHTPKIYGFNPFLSGSSGDDHISSFAYYDVMMGPTLRSIISPVQYTYLYFGIATYLKYLVVKK